MGATEERRLVLGIGNDDRGDDAAGRLVVRALRGMLPGNVDLIEESGEAAALIGRLETVDAAYLVDACASGAPAGTVRRFDVARTALPESVFGLSTHGFGLSAAVELARALGGLPRHCIVYAIEGASFDIGSGPSPAVVDAVQEVARRLASELVSERPEHGGTHA